VNHTLLRPIKLADDPRRAEAQFKRSILPQSNAYQDGGDISFLLRREGLYFSRLFTWRQRQMGEIHARPPEKRDLKVVVSRVP